LKRTYKKIIRAILKKKLILISITALLIISVVLMILINIRDFTTYSKGEFQISYPKGWKEDPRYHAATLDVAYTEESGNKGLYKSSPVYILLVVNSNENEYQYLSVHTSPAPAANEPIRDFLDQNLRVQKFLFPSTQEIARDFFLNDEGYMVANTTYTRDDPEGKLAKIIIVTRTIDGKDGSRWDIAYITEEANFAKHKEICERILNSFHLNRSVDWTKVGSIASIASIVIMVIIATVPSIKKRIINLKEH
jgi:hypothetical protein